MSSAGSSSAAKGERRKRLEYLSREERTIIFYEAPHKLKATLSDMCEILGEERKISLCRELTKINEEITRTTLANAVAYFSEKEPRGEFVLVVEGSKESNISNEEKELLSLTPEQHVQKYIDDGMAKMDAIKRTAKDRSVPKSEIYKIINGN